MLMINHAHTCIIVFILIMILVEKNERIVNIISVDDAAFMHGRAVHRLSSQYKLFKIY